MFDIQFVAPDAEHRLHLDVGNAEAIRILKGPQPGAIGIQNEPFLRPVLFASASIEFEPDRA